MEDIMEIKNETKELCFDKETDYELDKQMFRFVNGKYNDGLTTQQRNNKRKRAFKSDTVELPFDDQQCFIMKHKKGAFIAPFFCLPENSLEMCMCINNFYGFKN